MGQDGLVVRHTFDKLGAAMNWSWVRFYRARRKAKLIHLRISRAEERTGCDRWVSNMTQLGFWAVVTQLRLERDPDFQRGSDSERIAIAASNVTCEGCKVELARRLLCGERGQ